MFSHPSATSDPEPERQSSSLPTPVSQHHTALLPRITSATYEESG